MNKLSSKQRSYLRSQAHHLEPVILIGKKGEDPKEVINEEASTSDGDEHVSSKTENMKDDENEKVLSDNNEQVSIIADLETKDENNSAGESSTEETLEILNQEKEGEPSAKSEEE